MRLALAVAVALLLGGCVQVQLGEEPPPAEPARPTAAGPRPLTVAFTADPAAPRVGQTVVFQASVQGLAAGDKVSSATWRFGDGSTSAQTHPIHSFAAAGPHAVNVTVRSAAGAVGFAERRLTVLDAGDAVDPSAAPAVALLVPPTLHASLEKNRARFTFEAPYVPDSVAWEFGDGATATGPVAEHVYLSTGNFTVALRATVGDVTARNSTVVEVAEVPFQPHVVVAVPDSGFNPYHRVFRRPWMTEHPCTYIMDYPCSVPALELTLDAPSYAAAFEADKAKWAAIKPGDVVWIPGTNIVAALCEDYYFRHPASDPEGAVSTEPEYCILDDFQDHGTNTASSVVTENPDVLLAVKEGGSSTQMFRDAGIPVDVYSVSWGVATNSWPVPTQSLCGTPEPDITVYSAGNYPSSDLLYCDKGHPRTWSVMGDDPAMSHRNGEFTSYMCRPVAVMQTFDDWGENCGTSFSAPTFAGALSKVVLSVRRGSGYMGGMADGMADPIAGLSVDALRGAVNATATYDLSRTRYPSYEPVVSPQPWLEFGWGFYDGDVANVTIAVLAGQAPPPKDPMAAQYMETQMAIKRALWGTA